MFLRGGKPRAMANVGRTRAKGLGARRQMVYRATLRPSHRASRAINRAGASGDLGTGQCGGDAREADIATHVRAGQAAAWTAWVSPWDALRPLTDGPGCKRPGLCGEEGLPRLRGSDEASMGQTSATLCVGLLRAASLCQMRANKSVFDGISSKNARSCSRLAVHERTNEVRCPYLSTAWPLQLRQVSPGQGVDVRIRATRASAQTGAQQDP